MNVFMDILRSDGSLVINKNLINSIGLEASILLGELLSKKNYYEMRGDIEDGWFYETSKMIELNTGLSYYQQVKAEKILAKEGFLKTGVRGIPAKKYYYIIEDEDNLRRVLSEGKANREEAIEQMNGLKTISQKFEIKEPKFYEGKDLNFKEMELKNSNVINNRNNNNRKNNNREIIIDNNTSEKKSKEKTSKKVKSFDENSDPYKLALYQITRLKQLYPEMKLPQKSNEVNKWAYVFDLMIRRDQKTPEAIYQMIDFVYQDEFWSGVCLSPSNLRKNWDKIMVQRLRRKPLSKQERIREENEKVFQKFLEEDEGEDDKERDSGTFEAWFRGISGMESQ